MSQFVIFDTEFTAWPGSQQTGWSRPGEYKEIIQIGAIRARLHNRGIAMTSSLNVIIKPSINPKLSDYVQELTGIHQSLCDEHGIDFPSAARQFFEFVDSGSTRCLSWGDDETVLKENYRLNEMSWPFPPSVFSNLRNIVRAAGLSESHVSSGELAGSVGIDLQGRIHNALYDVKSIFAYLQHSLQCGKLDCQIFE